MKAKLIGLLSIVIVFSGCNKIDPVKITAASVKISKRSNSTFSSGKSILLSESSTKFVQDWLNSHRTGWGTYNPWGTFYSEWCMSLETTLMNPSSLCLEGGVFVLSGSGQRLRYFPSKRDRADFLLMLELANKRQLLEEMQEKAQSATPINMDKFPLPFPQILIEPPTLYQNAQPNSAP